MKNLPIPMVVAHDILTRQAFFWPKVTYDHWFLIISIKGSFTCTMQGRTWTLSEDDLCFFPLGVAFERKVIEEMQMHYFKIQWNCSDDELKESGLYPVGKVIVSNQERLKNTLTTLTAIHRSLIQNRSEIVTHCIRDIWMQHVLECRNISTEPPSTLADPVMQKAMAYMHDRVYREITVAETAAYCGMTMPQFSRRFKTIFGCSPVDYLTSLRIQKAKKYLAETNLPISRIAVMCGYDNQFYFSRRFCLVVGVSPQQYRNTFKKI